MTSPDRNQSATFSNFWAKFSSQIELGEGKVDFPSGSELLPFHVSTIIRLPSSITMKLRS